MKLTRLFYCSVLIGAFAMLFSSCSINRDFILRSDEDYVFNALPQDTSSKGLVMTANMIITYDLYTNDGALVLEYTTSDIERAQVNTVQKVQYFVESDGFCEFPLIGRHKIAGMSLQECQTYLEDQYRSQFVNPFVQITVLNRRVLVFNGNRAEGTVVGLTNDKSSLIEVLAMAGGLGNNADARKIRVFRKVNGVQEIYKVDLSTIEGIKNAHFVIENGDIVHVEPVPQIAREVQQDLLPAIQIISSLAIIYGVFARLF